MSRFEAVTEQRGVDQFDNPVTRHMVYDRESSMTGGIIAICPDHDSAIYVRRALEMLHDHQGSLPAPVQPPAFPAPVCPFEVVYGNAVVDGNFLPVVMQRPHKPWSYPDYMKWLGDTSWRSWQHEILSNPDHEFCKDDNHAYNGPNGLCSRCGWDEVPF